MEGTTENTGDDDIHRRLGRAESSMPRPPYTYNPTTYLLMPMLGVLDSEDVQVRSGLTSEEKSVPSNFHAELHSKSHSQR